MKKFFSLLLAALFVSTQAFADKVTASTTLPSEGKPEHVYTMVNGNGVYAGPTTAPATDENGLFAFYAVDGVDGAYYIYSHSAKQWLGYTKAASYNNGKGLVTLSAEKVDGAYFKVDNYSDDNYQIQPYTTSGSVAGKYLNWYQGVSANTGITLGLWQDNGAADAGSRYTFVEVVIAESVYSISVPEGVTFTIDGEVYANGSTITVEGSFDKSRAAVAVEEGMFAVVSVDDVNKTITVNVATLPVQPYSETYENAWVYPKQQENVGVAKIAEADGVYTLSNNVLAASYMKVGNALYFAGSNAMNLVAGTEPFTVAFGSGDNVPASAMTLVNVYYESLSANASAIGGAEHFAGVQLVANYEYTYKETKIEIVWRAVLRDGSHYLRTEMELTGVDDVDMYNVIPMIYNVDTEAAGSAPKVVGNTRGAVLMSDKIFAGLETPTAYNTVGEASGDSDPWDLTDTKNASLTASSWTQVAEADVPKRVEEATGANYPNVYAYDMENVTLKEGQKVSILVKYTSGSHRLNFGGAVLLDANGDIAAVDYHSGYSGGQHSNNTFTFLAPYDGTFTVRVFVENKTESIDASSTMTVDIYTAKEGAVINTAIVGIQGLWSRNTTLAAGETWKVASVVGLVAQDGTQSKTNIRETQKRRSFLAYSERERAVPWRTFPHYNSWYELNINRNNAAPGSEHTNFTAEDILRVMRQWKEKYYDKYGEGIAAFVIDDGWDNYGPWTFHSGFPNEMRDMSTLAKEMNSGIGAWLGPVGGYGQSGNYRRAYWNANRGGMQLSNPAYYEAFLAAADNLVCQQDGVAGFNRETDNYVFFKFDGISAQFSAVGPDAGDTGNENAEGIIRLEQYVRENMREDIFFNTTVGTWASPFWYQISDATWRQENDHDRIGNNSINRENWITYRDRLVYQNYVQNSPICPINTLMTHGFILSEDGPPAGDSRDYNAVLRELRCAFVCGSGIVELYTNCNLMNTINDGKLWEDVAECVAWQKKNADVLPDAHWVGGNPWNGSKQEVYGWASWNGAKATLALRNGGNSALTYTFTLREALEIPANITGAIILTKSFKVQDALEGLTEGTAIDIDQQLTVTLPGSTVFAFDGVNADPSQVPFEVVSYSPKKAESISSVKLEFNFDVKAVEDAEAVIALYDETKENVVAQATYEVKGSIVTVTLANKVTTPGNYLLVVPEGVFVRNSDDKAYSGELALVVTTPEPIKVTSVTPSEDIYSLSTIEVEFNKEVEDAATGAEVVLNDASGEKVVAATYSVEGKVLTVTLASEVTTPGEYTLVIPEGVVKGAAIGDAFNGTVTIVVEEFDVYEPRYTGTKTRADRAIKGFTLTGASGENTYTLTADEQTQDYTNATSTVFKVEAGEELTISFNKAGSWIHQFVFIDFGGDGFTASIAEGSEWAPAEDLVAYSFYNNNSDSDASGWNSKGTVITGNDRNTPAVPAFNAPEAAGTYRMRIKQDWCNIDPAGDADGKFDDFKANGGQIIDVMLEVAVPTGILNVNSDSTIKGIYDVHGRKIEQITAPGLYIVNGKKVLVK